MIPVAEPSRDSAELINAAVDALVRHAAGQRIDQTERQESQRCSWPSSPSNSVRPNSAPATVEYRLAYYHLRVRNLTQYIASRSQRLASDRYSCVRSQQPQMKYRVEIYDETYLINAKTLDGAIRGAIARYGNKSPSAVFRHCQPSRISRNSTFYDDRIWHETGKSKPGAVRPGRWRKCRYLIGVTAIVVHPAESVEQPAPSEANPELAAS
jgi:hypothetical protein